jgi:hypothetical protein
MMGTVRWKSGSQWSIRWWVSAPGLVVAAASVVVLAGRFTAGGTTITGRMALVGALSFAAGGFVLSAAHLIGPRHWLGIVRVAGGQADLRRFRDDLAALVARQWAAEYAQWHVPTDPVPPVAAQAARFRAAGVAPLVVGGGPGSGRTTWAVAFTRCLLATRTPQEPVPVVLSLSTWIPASPPLRLALDLGIPLVGPDSG